MGQLSFIGVQESWRTPPRPGGGRSCPPAGGVRSLWNGARWRPPRGRGQGPSRRIINPTDRARDMPRESFHAIVLTLLTASCAAPFAMAAPTAAEGGKADKPVPGLR